MNNRKLLVQAIAIAIAGWAGTSTSAPAPIKPDGLLAVDLNRSTIIDGVVSTWGTQLEKSGAALTSDQLRSMLEKLRADQLLAASVAGSLSGLRLHATLPKGASLAKTSLIPHNGASRIEGSWSLGCFTLPSRHKR